MADAIGVAVTCINPVSTPTRDAARQRRNKSPVELKTSVPTMQPFKKRKPPNGLRPFSFRELIPAFHQIALQRPKYPQN